MEEFAGDFFDEEEPCEEVDVPESFVANVVAFDVSSVTWVAGADAVAGLQHLEALEEEMVQAYMDMEMEADRLIDDDAVQDAEVVEGDPVVTLRCKQACVQVKLRVAAAVEHAMCAYDQFHGHMSEVVFKGMRMEDIDEMVRTPWEAATAVGDLEAFGKAFADSLDEFAKPLLKEPKIDEVASKEGLKKIEKKGFGARHWPQVAEQECGPS